MIIKVLELHIFSKLTTSLDDFIELQFRRRSNYLRWLKCVQVCRSKLSNFKWLILCENDSVLYQRAAVGIKMLFNWRISGESELVSSIGSSWLRQKQTCSFAFYRHINGHLKKGYQLSKQWQNEWTLHISGMFINCTKHFKNINSESSTKILTKIITTNRKVNKKKSTLKGNLHFSIEDVSRKQ